VADSDAKRTRAPGIAFLLSQLGGHSSRQWTTRLAAIGLEPREVMLFRHVALSEGRSQQELAAAIGLPPSRIVGLVDRLEAKGWIERRTLGADRRRRELYLTGSGREVLGSILDVSREHEKALTSSLGRAERDRLLDLLERVAAAAGLIDGVHPGFADPRADPSRNLVMKPARDIEPAARKRRRKGR
jgi:DNA-binding MarR family transcriptional regulator